MKHRNHKNAVLGYPLCRVPAVARPKRQVSLTPTTRSATP